MWKKPIVQECEGCARIQEWDSGVNYCTPYLDPAQVWRRGKCPMATHVKKEPGEAKKVNSLKQSRRKARGVR
jgi:hypothetical protein